MISNGAFLAILLALQLFIASSGELCNILSIVKEYGLDKSPLSEKLPMRYNLTAASRRRDNGAIVTTFSSPGKNASQVLLPFRCQIQTQVAYAKKFGYSHYIVDDNENWMKER